MINLKELSLVSGKAAWMAYLVSSIGFSLSSFFAFGFKIKAVTAYFFLFDLSKSEMLLIYLGL
jgi:hypothetical protein